MAFAAMGGLSALVAACGGGDPIDEGAEPGTDFTGSLGVLIGTHMDPVKALLEQHQASVGFAPPSRRSPPPTSGASSPPPSWRRAPLGTRYSSPRSSGPSWAPGAG